MITFTIPGRPPTKNSRKAFVVGGKARVVDDAETKERIQHATACAIPHRPETPIDGPVMLTLTIRVARPVSWPRWKDDAADVGFVHATSAPDCGNVEKLVSDVLTRCGYWHDDAQVKRLVVEKAYAKRGEHPYVAVAVHWGEARVETQAEWKAWKACQPPGG